MKPIEGIENILGSVWWFIEDAASVAWKTIDYTWEKLWQAVDVVTDTASSVFKWVADTVEWVTEKVEKRWVFNLLKDTVLPTWLEWLTAQPQVNQKDKELSKRFKSMSWLQMTWDLIWWLFTIWKDAIFWTELKNNIWPWITETQIRSKVDEYQWIINDNYKTINDIANTDPKFTKYRDFNNQIVQRYLSEKNITTISDQNDFESFKQNELLKLNWYDQTEIINQWNQLQESLLTYQKEIDQKQNELKEFLNTNIKTDWTKTGQELFEDLQKKEAAKIQWNEFFSLLWELRNEQSERFDEDIVKDAKILVWIWWQSFNNLKDQIVDNMVTDRQYYLETLWMEDLPDNEKIAAKFKEVSDIWYKLNLEFLRRYASMKSNPEFSKLDDWELRKQVLKQSYNSLSDEEKEKYRSKESLVTSVSQLRNWQQLKDRTWNVVENPWSLFTAAPMALMDWISYYMTSAQKLVDNIYDNNKDEVPHYIKQETRSLITADEWNLWKFISTIWYNTDALVSLLAPMKIVWLPIKWIEKWIDLVAKWAKWLAIPIKVWYWTGVLKVLPKALKWLTTSLLEWAAWDAIFDNVMIQSPSKTSEEFNAISWLLFDTTLYWAWRWINLWADWISDLSKKAYNNFMYDHIFKEEWAVVEDYIKKLDIEKWIKIDKNIWINMLKEWERQINNLYSPKKVKEIFSKPWELFNFISTNIRWMEQDNIKQMITAEWLWVHVNDALWMTKQDYNSIINSVTNVYKEWLDQKQLDINKLVLDNHLNNLNEYINWKWVNDLKIVKPKDEAWLFAYNKLKTEIEEQIKQIKIWNLKKDEAIDFADLLTEKVEELQDSFSNQKFKRSIVITPVTWKNQPIQIYFDDIDDFKQWYNELIKKWQVTIKEWTTDVYWKKIIEWKYLLWQSSDTIFETNLKKAIDSNIDIIKWFSDKYNIPEWTVKWAIKNVIWWGITKIDILNDLWKEEADEIFKELTIHTEKIIKDLYWEKLFNKTTNVNLDPAFKNAINKNTDLVPSKFLIDYFNNQEWYYNLAYWNFRTSAWKVNVMYITFWKEITQHKEFANLFSWVVINKKWETVHQVSQYARNIAECNKIINKYWLVNWELNIEEWIKKAKIIYSTSIVEWLYKDWKISKMYISNIVEDLLDEFNLWEDEMESLIDFIEWTFINTDESMWAIINPMIYNLAYKYAEYKDVIDEIIKRTNKTDAHIKAFADLILSPKLYNDISNTLLKDKVRTSKIITILKDTVNKKWDNYQNTIQNLINKTDIQIENLKLQKKSIPNREIKDAIAEEISKLETKRKWLVHEFDKKVSFENDYNKILVNDLTIEFLRNTSENFSTIKSLDLSKEIWIKIVDITKQIENAKDFRSRILNNLTEKDVEILKDLLNDIWVAKTFSDQKSVFEKYQTKKTNQKITEAINRVQEIYLLKTSDVNIFDKSLLGNELRDFLNDEFTYDYAKQNNPIAKKLTAFFNWSKTWYEQSINDAIINWAFKWNEKVIKEWLSANELYHLWNNKFTELIDSLYATKHFSKKDIPFINKKWYRDFIESIIKDSWYTISVKWKDQSEIMKELVDDVIRDKKIFKRFKAIANRSNEYVNHLWEKIKADINLTLEEFENESWFKSFRISNDINVEKYNENILQTKQMISKWMDAKFIQWIDWSKFKYIEVIQWWKEQSLDNIFRNYFNKKFNFAKTEIEKSNFTYYTQWEIYKFIVSIINNTQDSKLVKDLWFNDIEALKNQLLTKLQIPEWYVFTWNFWDKDSVFTIYKSWLDIYNKNISDIDRSKIEIDLFEYEYAFANWYYNYTWLKNKFSYEQFKKAISSIKYSSYEWFKKVVNKIDEIFKEKTWSKIWIILDTQVIRKREAANMSNYKTFDDYIEKTKTLIIKEKHNDWIITKEILNSDWKTIKIPDLLEMEKQNKIPQHVKERLDILDTEEERIKFLEWSYMKDYQDWTSFVSKNLWEIRDIIQWWNWKNVEQFKDHYYWDTEKWRMLWKTLFNVSDINFEWESDNLVIIWDSSLKLKWWYTKYEKWKEKLITINWIEYSVIWEVKWTDTSFFKNASTDSAADDAETTLSDSIKSRIWYKYANELEKIQIEDIKNTYRETLESLNDYDISIDNISDIDNLIWRIGSNIKMWAWTNSIAWWKLKSFLSKVDEILNKPKDKWTSVFIRESSDLISPEEIIISQDSILVKQIRNESSLEKFKKEYKDLNINDKKTIDDNLYTIWYRYPVPSEYNLWMYKIRLSFEFKEYEKMWKEQVVTNPLTTYLKLEWDNDWDHIFFISAKSRMWDIVWKAIFWLDINSNLIDEFTNLWLKNKYIIAEQIEKTEKSLWRNIYDINEIKNNYKKIDISNSLKKSNYFKKDFEKFKNVNRLISRWSNESSSESYRIAVWDMWNVWKYDDNDIVWISIEWWRTWRIWLDYNEVKKAINSNVLAFVIDNKVNRNRYYNIWEREAEDFLIKNWYSEIWETWYFVKNKISLLDSRAIALEAKQSIWIVSATLRTIGILRQVFDKYDSLKWKSEQIEYWNKLIKANFNKSKTISIKELYDLYNQKLILWVDFNQFAASILQQTLDFGNSWKITFDKNWYNELLFKAWIDENIADFYKNLISPLSTWYKSIKLTDSELSKLYRDYKLVTSKFNKETKQFEYNKDWKPYWYNQETWEYSFSNAQKNVLRLLATSWSKWDIIEYLFKNTLNNWKNSIWEFIQKINTSYDVNFAVDYLYKWTSNKLLNEIKDSFRKTNWFELWYIAKYQRWDLLSKDQLLRSIEDMFSSEDFKNILDKNINVEWLWETSLRINLNKIKEYYNAKWNYSLQKELRKSIIDISKLPDDYINTCALYSMALWEQRIFTLLNNKQQINYLKSSDNAFIDRLKDWNINFWNTVRFEDFNETEIKNMISELKNEFKLSWVDEEKIAINNSIESLQERLLELNRLSTQELNPIETKIDKIELENIDEYIMPEFSYDLVDRSPQSINEIMWEFTDSVALAKDWLKFTMQWLFWKYAPKLLMMFDTIQWMLNSEQVIIKDWKPVASKRFLSNASDYHARQFSHQFFDTWDTIYRELSKAWFMKDRIANLERKLSYYLLESKWWEFYRADLSSAIESMKTRFKKEEPNLLNILDQTKFVSILSEYQDNVIEPVIRSLNEIQKTFDINIDLKYKNAEAPFSLVNDILEAHKWDPQFALILSWIKNQEEFQKYLKDNASNIDSRIWDSTVRMMTNVLYKKQPTFLDKILWFAKWFHYNMTYGTASTFLTQNSIVAWLSQILPNYVELRSYATRNSDKLSDAYRIIKKYWLLDSEDVLMFGTWHWKNMHQSFIEQTVSKFTKELWTTVAWKFVSADSAKRAWETIDSFLNNMLWFNDFPLENLRKLTAVMQVMEQYWYKTWADIDKAMMNWWIKFKNQFESIVRRQFANSWWWVVSSSPIASWTVFEHANELFDNFVTRFAVQSFWYLMWWSYHKAAQLIEKESALLTWVKKLIWWDVNWFKTHLNDWAIYNSMLLKQAMFATWIYLKFQKYEKDNENRITLWEFQEVFNNSIVSLKIIYEKQLNAFNTAWEYWTSSDQVQYTTKTILDRMLRLFKQPAFLNTAYDRYTTQSALWKWDMFEAFQYAVKQHYTAYLRFSWMQEINDYYWSLSQDSNLWILWMWWNTEQDKMFNELNEWKSFASFKDKWFIRSVLSWFTSLAKWDSDNLSYSVAIDLAKELQERIQKDPNLWKLLKWWQLWSTKNDYNIESLIWKSWKDMTSEEESYATDIFKQLYYNGYSKLDDKGKRAFSMKDWKIIEPDKVSDILETQINSELMKHTGKTLEQLVNDWVHTPELLKTLAVMDLNSAIKTPLVLYTIMNKEKELMWARLKEQKWLETWEVSQYWTKYTKLSDKDYTKIERDLLIKYQEYLNLDWDLVMNIIEKDISKNHSDLFSKFESSDNFKYVKADVNKLVTSEYLINNVMKNWDTKVAALQSRYALAFKWLKWDEIWLQVWLKFLNQIETNPNMEKKVKLANQAAVIMWMNASQYNLFKDNKRFQELTWDAQKQLTNWLFKVSSESLDYDSISYANDLNWSASKRFATWLLKSPYKSSSFSWARPNFAQQFNPIRQFIPWKEQYLSNDPNTYIKAKQDFRPQWFWINPAKFPIRSEYNEIIINNVYYWFKSKWIIPMYVVWKKVDEKEKKYINLKKPVKKMQKKFLKSGFEEDKFAPKKQVSKWLYPWMPFSNY